MDGSVRRAIWIHQIHPGGWTFRASNRFGSARCCTGWRGAEPGRNGFARRRPMTTSLSPKGAECRLGGRIGPTHLERLAIVYVRQSTPQQIERNQESTRLQYALVERATQLGWSADQVVVIDDDLGRSGQSIEGRPGFQRLVAEVALVHGCCCCPRGRDSI